MPELCARHRCGWTTTPGQLAVGDVFAGLDSRDLSAEVWGAKASRLSTAARAHLPVPEAVCVTRAFAAADGDALAELVEVWLKSSRPDTVIVRTSSTSEDGFVRSEAGTFLTIRDVAPNVASVVHAIAIVCREPRFAAGCVLIQHQLPFQWMGVASLLSDGRIYFEASRTGAGVTSGIPPELRGSIPAQGGAVDVAWEGQGGLPGSLPSALRRLHELLDKLFPFDMDVEWLQLAGQLFLLQVRPLTGSPGPSK